MHNNGTLKLTNCKLSVQNTLYVNSPNSSVLTQAVTMLHALSNSNMYINNTTGLRVSNSASTTHSSVLHSENLWIGYSLNGTNCVMNVANSVNFYINSNVFNFNVGEDVELTQTNLEIETVNVNLGDNAIVLAKDNSNSWANDSTYHAGIFINSDIGNSVSFLYEKYGMGHVENSLGIFTANGTDLNINSSNKLQFFTTTNPSTDNTWSIRLREGETDVLEFNFGNSVHFKLLPSTNAQIWS